MDIKRLEIISTFACNSHCRHCLIQPQVHHNETMAPYFGRGLVDAIGRRYHPFSVMVFGGEPILPQALPTTLAIIDQARMLGILDRQVLTNGVWFDGSELQNPKFSRSSTEFLSLIPSDTQRDKIKAIAFQLAAKGVNNIEISADAFHFEFLPFNFVVLAAEMLLEAGIPRVVFSPRWLGSAQLDNVYNKETSRWLEKLKKARFQVTTGEPIQARGNAVDQFPEYFPRSYVPGQEKCRDIPDFPDLNHIKGLCISPLGDIIICRNVIIGRATPETVISMLERYTPAFYPDLCALQEKGLKGLTELAARQNIQLSPGPFHSICDACFYWRNKLGFTRSCNA